jgi:A/G-specific adenine glycosylase
MLQQTPVARVAPVWEEWLRRWPAPPALAVEPSGAAVAAWGRLGYPRRALWLHASAVQCVHLHDGQVPETYSDLLALPGVGDYTASAVAAFAFGQRHVVLDTNIRRVLARVFDGVAFEPAGAPRRAERERAASLLPTDARQSVHWNIGLMELGATICSARNPNCASCPVRGACAWERAGKPAWTGPPRRGQAYEGTDRQARGRLLAAVRDSSRAVHSKDLDSAWPDPVQRQRALASLVDDGLLEMSIDQTYHLPGRAELATRASRPPRRAADPGPSTSAPAGR